MRVAAVFVALGALLTGQFAFGGTEQTAGSWQVSVGEQTKAPAGTPKQTFLNQFFPGQLTINAGDKVTFSSVGFHTASYTAGKPFPPFLVLSQREGLRGHRRFGGRAVLLRRASRSSNTGSGCSCLQARRRSRGGKFASSGVIVAQNPTKPVTATYTFPQVGKFKMVCLIHPPDMAMNIVVKPKGAAVPTGRGSRGAAQRPRLDAAWAIAEAVSSRRSRRGTRSTWASRAQDSGGRTTVLDFVPNLTTVKAGTTVNFVVKAPTEAHNAAFGPLKYLDKLFKQTDLFPMGPNSKNQVHAVLRLRERSAGNAVRRQGDPRQRVLRDAAPDAIKGGSAAERGPREVHDPREVPLHLPAPRP